MKKKYTVYERSEQTAEIHTFISFIFKNTNGTIYRSRRQRTVDWYMSLREIISVTLNFASLTLQTQLVRGPIAGRSSSRVVRPSVC